MLSEYSFETSNGTESSKSPTKSETDKYKPTQIEDLICDSFVITCFIDWLKKFEIMRRKGGIIEKKKNNIKKTLLITGNHGVGKTCITHTILKKMGYVIRSINFSELRSNKNIDVIVKNLIGKQDIVHVMTKANVHDKYEKFVIVIDELESISSSVEKNCINTIIAINDREYICPIIFISNNDHNKFISDVKKISYEIKIRNPTQNDMMILLKTIGYHRHIKIQSEAVANKIIEHSQNDLRKLCTTLEDIKSNFGKTCLTMELFNQYITNSCAKNIDIDLFMSARSLLTQYQDIDTCMRLYEVEKVLLPLTIHQNYIKILTMNNIKNVHKCVDEISDAFSVGDIIENYIYGEQSWDLQELHGFYTCVVPSHTMNTTHITNKYTQLDFSSDLNKTSIKNINKKNIINASKCFSKMNILDYIYISKIFNHLISIGDIQKMTDMVKDYNINLEHIESILKVDKIKTYKTQLTAKQKKDIRIIFNKP